MSALKALFAKSKKGKGELYIYEEIGEGWFGGITAKQFADTVKELGDVDELDIFINSPGGAVFDGLAIYNQIRRIKAKKVTHIDGMAASIASVIALASDEVRIAANGVYMIHDPWGLVVGTADEMRKTADDMDKVRDTILDTYVARTSNKRDKVQAWMSAETWFSAKEAKDAGFVDAIDEDDKPPKDMAFAMLQKFRNVPEALARRAAASDVMLAKMQKRIAAR